MVAFTNLPPLGYHWPNAGDRDVKTWRTEQKNCCRRCHTCHTILEFPYDLCSGERALLPFSPIFEDDFNTH